MANTVTLAQLRADARLYADQRPGGSAATVFIKDSEVNRLVNMAIRELYDMLVSARGHEFYISEATVNVVANTNRYNLPSDFYELLSLTLAWSTDNVEEVPAYNSVRRRPDYLNGGSWTQWGPKAFRVRGTQIEILPTPASAVTATLQYIPAFADLTGDSSTFDGVNGWERLVTLRTAVEMLAIAKQSTAEIRSLYEAEKERVQGLADDRAAEHPAQIEDVWPEGDNRRWPFHGRRVSIT